MNELQGELHQLEAWERLPAGGGDNRASSRTNWDRRTPGSRKRGWPSGKVKDARWKP